MKIVSMNFKKLNAAKKKLLKALPHEVRIERLEKLNEELIGMVDEISAEIEDTRLALRLLLKHLKDPTSTKEKGQEDLTS